MVVIDCGVVFVLLWCWCGAGMALVTFNIAVSPHHLNASRFLWVIVKWLGPQELYYSYSMDNVRLRLKSIVLLDLI